MRLRRYWITFDFTSEDRPPPGTLIGCGVTAADLDDALGIVRNRVFQRAELPRVTEVREDVDVSTLDAGHVLPNMGVPSTRGVWFPLGYNEPPAR